jgi:uncharacterized protein (TIGR03083 family)
MAISHPDAGVAELAEAWGSLCRLARSVDEPSCSRPTACAGWTVKDQFSHLIGTELLQEGAPVPPPVATVADHVRNPAGEVNERFVEARRPVAARAVVDELCELLSRRLAAVADLEHEARAMPTPDGSVGLAPYVDYLSQRSFESFVHEQDVRHALGRPGGRGGAVERAVLDRLEASMPFVLGRRVAPPPGTTLRIEVTGTHARSSQLVVVRDGAGVRARAIEVLGAPPTATIYLDEEVFVRRACGRLTATAALRRPSTSLGGDRELGHAFVEQMVVVD